MSPTHSTRNGTKRYRYYVCTTAQKRGWHNCPSKSIPAGEIEQFVVDQIKCIGRDPALITETIVQAGSQARSQVAALDSERGGLERDLAHWNEEVHTLVRQIPPGDEDTAQTARLADLQERIRGAERRATEIREQVLALNTSIVDEHEVATALAALDPVWDSLAPREQTRIIQLLVERVDYDGASAKVSITFHPSGIKTLAHELAAHETEAVA